MTGSSIHQARGVDNPFLIGDSRDDFVNPRLALEEQGLMPPKRQARLTPPLSSNRTAKKNKTAQSSIDSFFTSPTKPKQAKSVSKRERSVINFVDSDDESHGHSLQLNGDEALARKLAAEWEDASHTTVDKGKARAPSPITDEGDDIVAVAGPESAPGVNGSSSSAHILPSVKLEQQSSPKKDIKPAFVIARPKTPPPPDTKLPIPSPSTPSKSSAITSISAEPVDPVDFDVDSFLFQPSEVDISKWPKGRLPYSVLVGVYVQVSSTRSRLTIVRVLTK